METDRSAVAAVEASEDGLGQCHTNTTESLPPLQKQLCSDAGGDCLITVDAFYILIALCAMLGVGWLRLFRAPVSAPCAFLAGSRGWPRSELIDFLPHN
eukprot:COSAG05_NODE_610_length_8361_cov_211.582789_8_plen_99_part_00